MRGAVSNGRPYRDRSKCRPLNRSSIGLNDCIPHHHPVKAFAPEHQWHLHRTGQTIRRPLQVPQGRGCRQRGHHTPRNLARYTFSGSHHRRYHGPERQCDARAGCSRRMARQGQDESSFARTSQAKSASSTSIPLGRSTTRDRLRALEHLPRGCFLSFRTASPAHRLNSRQERLSPCPLFSN